MITALETACMHSGLSEETIKQKYSWVLSALNELSSRIHLEYASRLQPSTEAHPEVLPTVQATGKLWREVPVSERPKKDAVPFENYSIKVIGLIKEKDGVLISDIFLCQYSFDTDEWYSVQGIVITPPTHWLEPLPPSAQVEDGWISVPDKAGLYYYTLQGSNVIRWQEVIEIDNKFYVQQNNDGKIPVEQMKRKWYFIPPPLNQQP